ncbi:MAG: ATP-binding protein, partial [Planctomycetota bacterium]
LEQLKKERAELVSVTKDLESANSDLQRKNSDLDEFCYVASHDLQEPLRKIVTFRNLFEKKYSDVLTGDGLLYLEFMADASNRMKNLITDLLALSRMGRSEFELEKVRVEECVDIAIDFVQMCIDERQAVVEKDELPIVLGDWRMLSQVFQNLIGNALKFVPKDRTPHIRITAERDGNFWRLGVRDNGNGIEPEYADNVFKPFKRLQTLGDGEDGTGIGLSICRKAVNRMGGEIWAESDAGNSCHFLFKMLAADETPQAAESNEEVAHGIR